MSTYKIPLSDKELEIIKLCLAKATDEMPASEYKLINEAVKLLDKLNDIPF